MSRIDLYPNAKSPPSDAKVATGTEFAGDKVAQDVNVLNSPTVSGTFTPSGLTTGGLITHVALTDAAWTAIPTTPLSGRNGLSIQNISGNGNVILWNYSAAAPATEGWRIEDGGHKSVDVTDSIIIYCRMLSGAGTACVDEVA